MTTRRFSLNPIRRDEPGRGIKITGSIERRANTLSAGCVLAGNLSGLTIPDMEATPGRKDRLWEETCLEFFLAVKDSARYWEFNLSPSGEWNVYRFTSYRKGMQEEPVFSSLPFVVRREPEALAFFLALDIGNIIPANKDMEVGVAAVIKSVKGATSHWALVHPCPRPDFHRRDGFLLDLSAKG